MPFDNHITRPGVEVPTVQARDGPDRARTASVPRLGTTWGGAEDLDTARLIQAESLYRKAEILLRAGNFAGALEFLRPCVALWPDDATYQASLGWALYKKAPSEPKPAREHLEQAIALDANDAIAHFRLGMVLRALGDEENAAAMLARSKRLDPKARA